MDVLNSFDRLESIYRYVRNQTSTSAASPLNYERFLLHTLRHAGLCIRYMLPVAGHRLALLYANVWHQGGSWEVASGDPYVKVAWCKYLPRYCCGELSLDSEMAYWHTVFFLVDFCLACSFREIFWKSPFRLPKHRCRCDTGLNKRCHPFVFGANLANQLKCWQIRGSWW